MAITYVLCMLLDCLNTALGTALSRHCRVMVIPLSFPSPVWFISCLMPEHSFFSTFPFLSSFFTSLTLNSNHLVAWSQPTDNCQQLWNQGECACQRWNLLRTLCTPSIIYANLPLSQIPPTQKIFRGLGPSVHFLR